MEGHTRWHGVRIREFLTTLGVYTAHPAAFLILIVYTICWFVFEPETLNWHGVASLATWCMTLIIQRAEHRDTSALRQLVALMREVPHSARPVLFVEIEGEAHHRPQGRGERH